MELGIADDGECAGHEQAAQIAVPLFADTAEPGRPVVKGSTTVTDQFDHLVGGDRKSLRPTVHWPTLIMLTTVVISSKALL